MNNIQLDDNVNYNYPEPPPISNQNRINYIDNNPISQRAGNQDNESFSNYTYPNNDNSIII